MRKSGKISQISESAKTKSPKGYTLQKRINFVENSGYLYYSNAGTFIPGTLENALRNEEPQTHFQNIFVIGFYHKKIQFRTDKKKVTQATLIVAPA